MYNGSFEAVDLISVVEVSCVTKDIDYKDEKVNVSQQNLNSKLKE